MGSQVPNTKNITFFVFRFCKFYKILIFFILSQTFHWKLTSMPFQEYGIWYRAVTVNYSCSKNSAWLVSEVRELAWILNFTLHSCVFQWPPMDQNFLGFICVFLGNFGKIVCWHPSPPTWRIVEFYSIAFVSKYLSPFYCVISPNKSLHHVCKISRIISIILCLCPKKHWYKGDFNFQFCFQHIFIGQKNSYMSGW